MININKTDPRLFYALISILTSAIIYAGATVTNTDGILYLRIADTYIAKGFPAAADIYTNPYYSILLAIFSQLFSVTTFTAAKVINSLCCGVIAWLIVDLCLQINKDSKAGWIAGLLFLLYPQFNEYRSFVIRDFFFFACVLGFLASYLRFIIALQYRYLLLGILLIILGLPFRVEIGVFILVPLLALLILNQSRLLITRTLKIYAGIFAIFCISAIIIVNQGQLDAALLSSKGYINNFINLYDSFSALTDKFNQHILRDFMSEFTPIALAAAFLVILLLKTLETFTAPFLLISFICRKEINFSRFQTIKTKTLFLAAGLYLFTVYIHLLSTTIIQSRHVALVSLLAIPFLATWILDYFRKNTPPLKLTLKLLTICLLLVLFVDSFFTFGPSKQYRANAAKWLQTQPAECQISGNNLQANYFSGMQQKTNLINVNEDLNTQINNTDLLVLELTNKSSAHEKIRTDLSIYYRLINTFSGKKKSIHIWHLARTTSGCQLTMDRSTN